MSRQKGRDSRQTARVSDIVLGVVLIILGVLIVTQFLEVPFLIEISGVLLVVMGIIILVRRPSSNVSVGLAVAYIAVGVLILAVEPFRSAASDVLVFVAGGLAVVLGVLKLFSQW